MSEPIFQRRRLSYRLPALSGLTAVVFPEGHSSKGDAHSLLFSVYQPQLGPLSWGGPSSIVHWNPPMLFPLPGRPLPNPSHDWLLPHLLQLGAPPPRPRTFHSSSCIVAWLLVDLLVVNPAYWVTRSFMV